MRILSNISAFAMARHMADAASGASTDANAQAAAPTPVTPPAFTIESLEKVYYAPEEIADKAVPYIDKVVNLANDKKLDVRTNFDPNVGVPPGFGIYVVPLQRRADPKKDLGADGKPLEGNITIGVAITAVPSLSVLNSDQRGAPFIQSAVNRMFESKIVASIRPRSDGKLPPEAAMPKTLEDFIENRRETQTYGAFTEVAKLYLPELRKQMAFLTPVVLRQCMQSKSYAASFPAVKDEFWVKLLDSMIAKSNAKGWDASVMVNWKNTRDEAQIDAAADVDLDAISALIA